MSVTAAQVEGITYRIERRTLAPGVGNLAASLINNGTTTLDAYIQARITAAKNSTRPALLVSQYFEGAVPSAGILDNRASFCLIQYNTYLNNGANADLGPYEALGKAFADTGSISAKVSGKTVDQIITDAYVFALGTTPSPAQITHFTSQHDSFYNLYVGAGIPTATASLHAKGAVIGQILGWGGSNLSTAFSGRATAWFMKAADGTENYGSAL